MNKLLHIAPPKVKNSFHLEGHSKFRFQSIYYIQSYILIYIYTILYAHY